MTPSPTPTPLSDVTVLGAELTVVAVVIGILFATAAIIAFSALIVRSARYPMPVPLIAPLSLLALVAMLIGGLLESAQELIPVAGAAVGALAATLTAVFRGKPPIEGGDDDEK